MEYSIRGHASEQGFTLIELLVAMTLAAVVLAAGYTVFQGSNRMATQQNLDNRMQDNARVAMDVIARNFRRAGFLANFGSYEPSWKVDDENVQLVSANSSTGPDGVTIVGGPLVSIGTLAKSASRGSDQLTLTDASAIRQGDMISVGLTFSGRVADPPAGNVIKLDTSVPTGYTNMDYPGVYLEDGVTESDQHPAPVRILGKTEYFVDFSTNQKHPVLMQKVRGGTPEPVAEDIEDLQLRYGIDLNNNRIIEAGNNEWVHAPTKAQINLIRLVRITIVARSAQPDPALVGKDQIIPAIEDHPGRTEQNGYRRFIVNRVVKTRNIDVLFTL